MKLPSQLSTFTQPILVLLLTALALLAASGSFGPEVARARKGYGGGGYHYCGDKCQRGRYAKQCRTGCSRGTRTCLFCAKQDQKEQLGSCRSALTTAQAACAGAAACGSQARATFRACKRSVSSQLRQRQAACAGDRGQCGGCCKSDPTAGCDSAFAGTAGFGTYFRSYRGYHSRPDCSVNGTGSNGGAPSQGCCDPSDVRCLRAKRGLGACTTTSTTVSTTTSSSVTTTTLVLGCCDRLPSPTACAYPTYSTDCAAAGGRFVANPSGGLAACVGTVPFSCYCYPCQPGQVSCVGSPC